jgi:RNA polymerase sigma-70 factor (ECF subfamily)
VVGLVLSGPIWRQGRLSTTSAPENALVERSRAGDVAAFNALVEAYQSQVYNFCLRMLSSPQGAEDATQDTFLSAYRHLAGFRGGGFRAWLLRIAANACTDELRRRRRRPHLSLDEPSDESAAALAVADKGESPEQRVLRAELSRQIEAALMELPRDQRLAVILCDLQGFSYEEIGESTGSSLGTVKSRISRGRARLRELLMAQRELLPRSLRHTS